MRKNFKIHWENLKNNKNPETPILDISGAFQTIIKSSWITAFLAPLVGLEPTTYRLTAERSTNWAKEEYINPGNFLFFQQGNPQVFSALKSLTSVFGMGTGISSSLLSPEILLVCFSTLKNI